MARITFAFEKITLRSFPVCVYSLEYQPIHTARPHFHDNAQIWFCTSGKYLHTIEGRDYRCHRGSVCIIPPGTSHAFVVDKASSANIFCIDLRYDYLNLNNVKNNLATLANSVLHIYSSELNTSPNTYIELCEDSTVLAEKLLSSVETLNKRYCAENLDAHYPLIEKFFSLPEFCRPDDANTAFNIFTTKIYPISRALAYINENFSESITISDLMHISALCQTNFTTYFRRYTNMSFAKYLQNLRVSRARRLLGVSDYPISYISDICGFANPAHMISCFKKCESRVPKEIRHIMKDFFDRNPIKKQNEKKGL